MHIFLILPNKLPRRFSPSPSAPALPSLLPGFLTRHGRHLLIWYVFLVLCLIPSSPSSSPPPLPTPLRVRSRYRYRFLISLALSPPFHPCPPSLLCLCSFAYLPSLPLDRISVLSSPFEAPPRVRHSERAYIAKSNTTTTTTLASPFSRWQC